MKKTNKTNPKYIVNLDYITCLGDIDVVFALAKQDAGLPISDKELTDIVEHAIENARPKFYICKCTCAKKKKKLPWYKRLWNWIRRK